MDNQTNKIWKDKLKELSSDAEYTVSPRGMSIEERIGESYKVPIPAYITLKNRKVNYSFMFAEAWWILSGSNRVEDIDPYMSFYKTFSDDSIVMRGAYGPKVIDQLGYVVDSLEKDIDSRQAVVNIWRERPAPSKDIPCTTSLQFIVREGAINCIVTMRSNDVVKGFTYDVFTFSMITLYVSHLLRARGIYVNLGNVFVNVGSLHLYKNDKAKVEGWINEEKLVSNKIDMTIDNIINNTNYLTLLSTLKEAANEYRNIPRT